MIDELKNKIENGYEISKKEALGLVNAPLDELLEASDELRAHFCGKIFDICSIINARSGKCSENCKFCAQSAHYSTAAEEYPLLDTDKIVEDALYNASKGVLRYSLVVSGKKLSDKETDKIYEIIKEIKKRVPVSICASLGLLSREQFIRLKEAGLERVHNNLETSENYFPNICSTHSFKDKIAAVEAAREAGLDICSGGIIGLGESYEDRIDMAFTLKKLGVRSVPINILNAIKGTPYENNPPLEEDEILRTVAVFRFILPNAFLRLAGGRALLKDKGGKAFRSGINAVITGDMLTTAGISVDTDMAMIKEAGYRAELMNG